MVLNMKDKIKYLRIALAIQHIGIKEIDLEKVIETYEAINEKGGDLNLEDIVKIECRVEESYKPEFNMKDKSQKCE